MSAGENNWPVQSRFLVGPDPDVQRRAQLVPVVVHPTRHLVPPCCLLIATAAVKRVKSDHKRLNLTKKINNDFIHLWLIDLFQRLSTSSHFSGDPHNEVDPSIMLRFQSDPFSHQTVKNTHNIDPKTVSRHLMSHISTATWWPSQYLQANCSFLPLHHYNDANYQCKKTIVNSLFTCN